MTELQWKPVIYLPVNLTVRFDAPGPQRRQSRRMVPEAKASDLLGPARKPQAGRPPDPLSRRVCGKFPGRSAAYLRNSVLLSRFQPHTAARHDDDLPGRQGSGDRPDDVDSGTGNVRPRRYSSGETEMTEISVPVGPALRVHRFRKADPAKRRTTIVEELAWVICPPESTQAVMMSTKWGETAFSKAAITIADEWRRTSGSSQRSNRSRPPLRRAGPACPQAAPAALVGSPDGTLTTGLRGSRSPPARHSGNWPRTRRRWCRAIARG